MDNGKASPSCCCCCSSSWLSAQCGSDAMSRISKGCCRANRGRETRTNCILTHANCQCPHLPTPLSPFACVLLRRASLLHYSGQVRDGRRLRTGRNCHFALCQRTLNAWAAKCGRRLRQGKHEWGQRVTSLRDVFPVANFKASSCSTCCACLPP